VQVKLKGLHWTRQRLSDGSVVTYYYAWRGGPRLFGSPGSAEFNASYQAAIAAKAEIPRGHLLWLLQSFQASSDFTKLSASTRRAYVAAIKRIEKKFGTLPLKALAAQAMRGEFLAWRDKIAAASGNRTADYVWTVLARVLAWGLNRGHVTKNPCERGGRLYESGARIDKVWTDNDEAALLRSAPAHLHLPFLLALWTGQRQGDLLRLSWKSYDGQHIKLKQSKTGAHVTVPVLAPLKAALDAAVKRSPLILVNSDGKPWTSSGFRASWRKACAKAGIVGLTFHDLRGSAVTRMAKWSCTTVEIARFTGHSLSAVTQILDAHYLGHDPAIAENVVTKFERWQNKEGDSSSK
jgi:integrase